MHVRGGLFFDPRPAPRHRAQSARDYSTTILALSGSLPLSSVSRYCSKRCFISSGVAGEPSASRAWRSASAVTGTFCRVESASPRAWMKSRSGLFGSARLAMKAAHQFSVIGFEQVEILPGGRGPQIGQQHPRPVLHEGVEHVVQGVRIGGRFGRLGAGLEAAVRADGRDSHLRFRERKATLQPGQAILPLEQAIAGHQLDSGQLAPASGAARPARAGPCACRRPRPTAPWRAAPDRPAHSLS